MYTRIFVHGLESNNQGTKSTFLREKFPDMIIPHFVGDLQSRMEKLKEILAGRSNIQLVGSSFGGLMACLFAAENEPRVEKMILLAPAINLAELSPDKERRLSLPVWIYHGRNDQVIPLVEVEPIARQTFERLSFHVLEDDHTLLRTFKAINWDTLLA